jgi:hypothetical protein
MKSTGAGPRGILLVCHCGNRFLVPKRQAGERVRCTLCSGLLLVPAERSVQQAAADALDRDDLQSVWKELVEQEGTAPALEKKKLIQQPVEKTPWLADLRHRTWVGVVAIAVFCLAILAMVYWAMRPSWDDPSRWMSGASISEQGGYSVGLPSGFGGSRSSQVLGPHPRWKYTFEGIRFPDQTRVGVVFMDVQPDGEATGLPDGVVAFLERECCGEVEVIDQCEIRLGSHPGRQVTYQHSGRGGGKSYARWFQVGDRLYGVVWASGYSQPSVHAVVRFLDSFRLLQEPDSDVTLVQGSKERNESE